MPSSSSSGSEGLPHAYCIQQERNAFTSSNFSNIMFSTALVEVLDSQNPYQVVSCVHDTDSQVSCRKLQNKSAMISDIQKHKSRSTF